MPPEARIHEPRLALDGGADGLDVQRRVVAGARDRLKPHGRLLIETSVEQSGALAAEFRRYGFDPEVIHDEDLEATVVKTA
jgi:release factor glutamine methyltransferase